MKGKNWFLKYNNNKKLRGNIIRFEVRWVEEGEKLINYFCYFKFWNFWNNIIKKVEVLEKGVIFN